jgi:hypothetical protein
MMAMSPSEIANLEHAARSAFAWTPGPDYEPRSRITPLVTALVPAIGILSACAVLLLGVF